MSGTCFPGRQPTDKSNWRNYPHAGRRQPIHSQLLYTWKIENHPVQFLIDISWATRLLSKTTFNRLFPQTQSCPASSDTHGEMENSSKLTFYGMLRATISLQGMKADRVFSIGCISENIILEMQFLANHKCSLDFNRLIVQLDGMFLECTDRQVTRWRTQSPSH